MNFSKTTEYALQIMNLMSKDAGKLFSVNEIYNNLNIPLRYLKKQMTVLSKSGLIKSIQGRQGGYKFSKKIDDICLYDIVSVTEDNILKNICFFGYKVCNLKKPCIMHNKWAKIRNEMLNLLKNTKLSELNKPDETEIYIK